jgi:UDP-2,3-diacylglucosamine pyrophosphatase LpxH
MLIRRTRTSAGVPMLVLVSDLHITDETAANNVNPEAFDLLGAEIVDAASRRGAREIRLVLLGDILDLVRSDYWHRHAVPMAARPWGGTLDPRTGMNADRATVEPQFQAVLRAVLATPTANALRTMLASLTTGPIPLRATYVIGNHERVMWNFPSLRETARVSLPQVAGFAAAVEAPEYGVLARHGHEWDEHTHGWRFRRDVLLPKEHVDRFAPEAYEVMAIGEAVTAELMSGLVFHARDQGAPASLVDQLKDVNNLRPLLDVFAWLEWVGGARVYEHRQMLHEALRRALDGLLSSTLAHQWDRLQTDYLVSGDLVDRLEQARAVLLGPDFESFRGRVESLERLQRLVPALLPSEDGLLAGARAEAVFQGEPVPGGIQRVIYGHTHRARHDYFSATPDGIVRMYVNTGTFLPLITRARDGRTFASAQQMTMVFAYREDEDTQGKRTGTTSIDIWNGTRRKLYG